MIAKQDLNSDLLTAEYAVRGPIVNRAQQLEEQGKKVIYCNIGNPQALKQKPLTYLRQILRSFFRLMFCKKQNQFSLSILTVWVRIHRVREFHSSEKRLRSSFNGGMEFLQTRITLF
jgi:hypothetical protein